MSLNPGVQQYGALDGGHVTTPDGTVKAGQPVSSITQDPMTPVEYGRTAADSKYTVSASNGEPIDGGSLVASGPVTGVTLVTTVSGQADGQRVGVATTSSGMGVGATVTYTVTGGVSSAASLVAGGSNYVSGEILTVADDTGTTLSVTI